MSGQRGVAEVGTRVHKGTFFVERSGRQVRLYPRSE